MAIATVSPVTGETLRTFKSLSAEEIAFKVERAATGFSVNRSRSIAERALRMSRAAELLEKDARALATIITTEMGKPIGAAVAEVQKCALACRYYAEHAASQLADEPVTTEAAQSFIRYEPLGVILAVMPWNFPFWQVFRFAAPALMAGNAALLKHASNVPQCALAIEQVLVDAGFSAYEFQTLLIGSDAVAALLHDDRIRAATLTGSEAAGASVASEAGKEIKKAVLELGGSDPFIVMPSANLEEAVAVGVKARTVNNGQSCIAAKRFIVHEAIADEFEARFVRAMKNLMTGDPMNEKTEIGPLATPQIVADLEKQLAESVAAGARILTGGRRIGEKGNLFAPTVITDVAPDSPAYREELFGPVASLFRVANSDEAIGLANATEFGLGASVWTNDSAEASRFVEGLESGQVFVNAMVASDPRMPFGGVKKSGFGRELGTFGIREFVNIKSVWIKSIG